MAQLASPSLVRQLGSLFDGSAVAGLTDRQLLERYRARRDPAGDAAFAALVARHGPMVLGVCRQLLGDRHLAEDAFQAVFLVLARKAPSLREPELLGNWLYGVALRTARKARGRLARRRQTEQDGSVKRALEQPEAPAYQPILDREQAEALHHEIDRLPGAFRAAVVLCYFEGLTLDEAAHRLRWPAGTLRSRLARARETLRHGLSRRGVALPAATLAAILAPRSSSASVSSLLCDSTTRAAIAFAARQTAAGCAVSASAAAMAREVIRAMLLHKLKFVAFSLLLLAAATSGGVAAGSLAMKQKVMSKSAALVSQAAPGDAERPRSAAKPDTAAADRMTVAGRVIDQDGKPVKGAVVELVAQSRSPWIGASEETFGSEHTLLGEGQSEGDGRFRLDAPRTGSTRVFQVYALAAAPGYGLGWAKLNPDAEQPAADIRLLPEQPIRARLVDVTGAPANRVEVRVRNIARMSDKGTRDSVWLWDNPPKGVRTWPQTVTTDDQGRFALPGIVHGDNVSLEVRDLRYARQSLFIDSSKLIIPSKEITLALEPARIIEGRVLSADTGRPIPNAVVSAQTLIRNKNASGYFTAKFRANAQGRFIMNPLAGESYTLGAFPTQGEPYLVPQDEIEWTKGAVKAIHDIKVRRGVLIRGKVTEQKTGRPLPASSVQYQPVQVEGGLLWGWQAAVASKVDGSFEIAVAPGKGHLLVFGPTGDYVLGSVAGQRTRAHAIIPYEVKVGDPPHEVAAPLRPGVTIKGRVEGPGGRTVTDGLILTTLHIEPFNPTWRGDFHVKVRDGRFELHGLDPNGATRIHVLDPDHEWGATVDVSGKQSGEDLTIRLEPCGKARARFVGWKGKPVFKVQPTYFELVATSGPSRYSKNPKDQGKPSADADFLANIDVKHYPWRNELNTDADGRFTMTSLIPDALYRILDFSTANSEKGAQVRKDFTVKPGETLDLGDILIEKPQPGEA